MKIVEFNGLPGCGKTTIADELYEYCKSKGISVCNFKTSLKGNMFQKMTQEIGVLFRAVLHQETREILLSGLRFLCRICKRNNLDVIKQYIYLNKITIILDFCLSNPDYEVILIDQGLVQGVVSFLYENQYQIEDMQPYIKEISKVLRDWYVVECMIDMEQVLQHLHSRKNGKSRVDRLDDSQKVIKLQCQNKIFRDVRQVYGLILHKVIRLDTGNIDKSENAKKIIEFLGV